MHTPIAHRRQSAAASRIAEEVNAYMMMKHMLPLFYRLLILVLSAFVFLPPHYIRATAGQLSDISIITQIDLETLLTTARANVAIFPTVFKDLAAEETKTVEIYEKPGALSGKRRIVSDFIVYQSQRDPAVMTEYRNVREVDGVAVSGRDERAIKLFERLAKADSITKELNRIHREGSRYDFGWKYEGFTLLRGLPLQKDLHTSFNFDVEGRERINGRDVIVVRFRHAPQSPNPKVGVDWLSDFKLSDPRYRGRLWLDAQTAQLWREEVELVMRSSTSPDPLAVSRFEFYYAPSSFEVWVPERMVFSVFSPVKLIADKVPDMYLRGRTTNEYGSFKRFDVKMQEKSLPPQQQQRPN